MKFITNLTDYENDIMELVRNFYTRKEIECIDDGKVVELNGDLKDENYLVLINIKDGDKTLSKSYSFTISKKLDDLLKNRYIKRYAKNSLYFALSEFYGKTLPWGSLTGVRPTKLGYELKESPNVEYMDVRNILKNDFGVSREKTLLVTDIMKNQKCIIKNDNLVNLYINIPFCPTRCSYCSFISTEFSKVEKLMPQYISCLLKEIRAMKKMMADKSLIVNTIYIGGGTPTTLSATQLEVILNELGYPVSEFTVECGRPDTITKDKLNVLKEYGVTRISINPQTFSNKTLKLIGRKHTVKDVYDAYKLALNYDFDINMDLIAGLPKESFRTFKKSIDTAIEFSPANITVHTLAIKNSSLLSQDENMSNENEDEEHNEVVAKMLAYAHKKLKENNYGAYYMYRLKHMCGSLENIGYCKENKQCRFNIYSMEENGSILACGAGGISKRVYLDKDKIERCANVKDTNEYINRIDEMIQRKIDLFK
jgi:coproporphyrinogen dehydrogenase HemZ